MVMVIVKAFTTVLICMFMAMIAVFMRGRDNTKVVMIGFGTMEAVYLLSIICIWI